MKLRHAVLLLLITLLAACSREPGGAGQPNPPRLERMQAGEAIQLSELPSARHGMALVAENAGLELLMDRETTSISVHDKQGDYTWHANPLQWIEGSELPAQVKQQLSSVFSLRFYDRQGRSTVYYTGTHSTPSGQYEAYRIDDGLMVDYTLGIVRLTEQDIPLKIGKERFEAFVARMPAEQDQEEARKRYRYVEEEDVYVQRQMPDYAIARIYYALQEAGYTIEDNAADRAEFGISGEAREQLQFKLAISYRLQGEELHVELHTSALEAPESVRVQAVRPLEFFGAASNLPDSYMLVPDGPGGIIALDRDKRHAQPYRANVYGRDRAIRYEELIAEPPVARLPVFGMKHADAAWVAAISQGDAMAQIIADIGGRTHPFASVGSELILAPLQQVKLKGAEQENEFPLFPEQHYAEDLVIVYSFLNGQQANYTGMASRYRASLLPSTGFAADNRAPEASLFVDVVGVIDEKAWIWGIPYQSRRALSTLEGIQGVADRLKEAGMEEVQMRLLGWTQDGMSQRVAGRPKASSLLGGTSGIQALGEHLGQLGYGLLLDTAMSEVHRDTLAFSPRRDGAWSIDRKTGVDQPYSPATYQLDTSASPAYLLSPAKWPRAMERYLERVRELFPRAGLSFSDLGNALHGDYRPGAAIYASESAAYAKASLQLARKSGSAVLIEGGNAYALAGADYLLNAPLSGSGHHMIDYEVPFFAMAVRGQLAYSGPPLNLAADQSVGEYVLKLLEHGANPYFLLSTDGVPDLYNKEFNHWFSIRAEDWMDELQAVYEAVSPYLHQVEGANIISHQQVEQHAFRTVYENGAAVIVNYNLHPITVDGERIPAEGFLWKEGGS